VLVLFGAAIASSVKGPELAAVRPAFLIRADHVGRTASAPLEN
jgi:hypothetical protein